MSSKYDIDVDLEAEGTSHLYMVELVGANKTVLDVGCSSGYLAKVLQQAGNQVSGIEYDPEAADVAAQYLEKIVVADLERTDLAEAFGDDRFEVIVFGDVLEHLRDPLSTLRQAKHLLSPDGYIVISIPNIAHGDVRMSLLLGRFTYNDLGLLDSTHVHFVTRQTLKQLLADAGYVATEIRVTTAPLFETELGVRREEVPADVVELISRDPDATTYQFVLTAVPRTGSHLQQDAAWLLAEAQAELRDNKAAVAVRDAELATVRASLEQFRGDLESLRRQLADSARHAGDLEASRAAVDSELAAARSKLTALESTRSFRLRRKILRLLGK